MPIDLSSCCERCGRLMKKYTTTNKRCTDCLDKYTKEEWRTWEEMRYLTPQCLYCDKEITGRAISTVIAGRVKFCSKECRAMYESKIKKSEWPEIVRLYDKEMLTAGDIGKRYKCSSTVILHVLRRFTILRVGALPGEANVMFGKTHTPLAKAKIREANRKQFSSTDARQRHAELTAKQIAEGRTGKAFNKLESAFCLILDDIGVSYQWQKRSERYVYDFLLHEINMLIEVHGTFWHADPRFYDHTDLRPTQERNIANDIRKEQHARMKGFEFAVFWEHDIYTSPIETKARLAAIIMPNEKCP